MLTMSAENLSPLERRILTVLEQSPTEWLSRNQIAERIGRTDGYTQNDVRALRALEEYGLIAVRTATIGIAKSMFEYQSRNTAE